MVWLRHSFSPQAEQNVPERKFARNSMRHPFNRRAGYRPRSGGQQSGPAQSKRFDAYNLRPKWTHGRHANERPSRNFLTQRVDGLFARHDLDQGRPSVPHLSNRPVESRADFIRMLDSFAISAHVPCNVRVISRETV